LIARSIFSDNNTSWILYIISLKMGDIDLLNVNVSHFKADNIFVRT
jgi:hypothetical protein